MATKSTSRKPAGTTTIRTKTTAKTTSNDKGNDNDSNDANDSELLQNLRLLQAILEPPAKTTKLSVPAKRPTKSAQTATVSQSVKTTSTVRSTGRAGKKPATAIDVVGNSILASPTEQKKLAMNSFNQSLKILSAYAKKRQERKIRKSQEDTSVVVKETTSSDEPNLENHAACACAALAVLRQCHTHENATIESTNQREHGAVLLLEKMITLDMKEMAHAEASRTYEQYWKRRKNHTSSKTTRTINPSFTLSDLLIAQSCPENNVLFDMTCAFQSQILRLAILAGSEAVTSDLVQAVRIEKKGSPAEIVLSGRQSGFMPEDKVGQNLRTISQALSKLYAIAVQSKQDPSKERSNLAFSLLAEAQLIKITSWNVLAHKPNLEPELWAACERGVKLLWYKDTGKDDVRYHLTRTAIENIQNHLRKNSYNSELPTSFQKHLLNLAELNDDIEQAVELLTNLRLYASGSEKLFLLCHLATLQLGVPGLDNTTLESTREVLQSFSQANHVKLTLAADQLLTVVRLRKACSQRLFGADLVDADDVEKELLQSCQRVLFAVLRFCSSLLDDDTQKDLKLRRSIYLAVLKTIEAITDAEKYALQTPGFVLEEYLQDLDTCLPLLEVSGLAEGQTVLDNAELSVSRSLQLRLSNVFWRAHLHPYMANHSLRMAQKSLTCLEGLSTEELTKAALGPRLEKLAGMYLSAEQRIEGKGNLERAIKHYIASGALVDAVEISLLNQSGKVWTDATSSASQLARTLNAYNSLGPNQDHTELVKQSVYDGDALPDVHRAILLEYQILNISRKRPDSALDRGLIKHVQTVTELTSSPRYHVWQLRFLATFMSRVTKIDVVEEELVDVVLQLLTAALGHASDTSDSFLKPYESSLTVLLKLQLSLAGQLRVQGSLREELADLEGVVHNCIDSENVDKVIDDAEILLQVLRARTEKSMALQEHALAASCLKTRYDLLKHIKPDEHTEMLACLVQLVQCQTRSDNLAAGRRSLAEAETLLAAPGIIDSCGVDFHLASAEYHLASDELDECRTSLEAAGKSFTKTQAQGANLSSMKQIERDSITAKGVLLASQLALRQGKLGLASQYARQAAKISISIWAALERRKTVSKPVSHDDSSMGLLTKDLSKLDIASQPGAVGTRASGVRVWPYLDMHVRIIRHAGTSHAHSGLYDDALHYYNQLSQVALSMHPVELCAAPGPALAVLYAGAGRQDDARRKLADYKHRVKCGDIDNSMDALLSCSEAFMILEDIDSASLLLRRIPTSIKQAEQVSLDSGQNQVTKPANKPRRGVAKSKTMKAPAKRLNDNALEPSTSAAAVATIQQADSCLSAAQLQLQDRQKALMNILDQAQGEHYKACTAKEVAILCATPTNLVQELFALARCTLSEAWKRLCADSMQSVLTDSAVALPSKVISRGRHGRVSFLQAGFDRIDFSPLKDLPQLPQRQESDLSDVANMLRSALYVVNVLMKDRMQFCSTDMSHALVKMEARISLLLTTMNLPFAVSSTDLVLKVSQPKDSALERERLVALAERATQERSSLSTWPTQSNDTMSMSNVISARDLTKLPASWSIVSLTLADSEDELLLTKINTGRSPFLVRIPLRRSNEGDGIDEFVFEDVRKEMKDIIDRANSSSHDVRGTAEKTTRAEWHADREVLDERLRLLLQNIESIWLGGFRGILSPAVYNEKLVKNFAKALASSLDRHLPSRQKTGSALEKIEIHDHVLEIFLGLGSPAELDLDDAIMDLLYFVVDILQFDGEKNAYDEIDWDAILVDVLDALTAYHESASSQLDQHTILILDKELECFPWESLPCLINHPVSRMPSLGSVFERLDQIRLQASAIDAYTINKATARGSYILNPSGDLKSTQALFEPILATNLPTTQYTSLINTAPTEAQFSSLLSTSDLCLYFGHGSGAQYIRGRTIRALPQCAVTFLFGCSSAKMTEHGVYESTGMPRCYVLGHAPAVVGCLWDVTDREIDRVALRTVVEWELVEGEDERVKEALKRKGRKDKRVVEVRKGGRGGERKSLVEAVREGREACVLRYLCGAAVVVYGIPVVLE